MAGRAFSSLLSTPIKRRLISHCYRIPSISQHGKFGSYQVSNSSAVKPVMSSPSNSYSTKSQSDSMLSNIQNSRVSFRLVNALYAGLIGTLILYAFQRRGKKKRARGKEQATQSVGRFEDKVVVVTGGAGDIGMSTASAFASEGALVFLVDLPRMESHLREKCQELKSIGAKSAEYVMCDMTREEDVKKMVSSIADKAKRIDFLFNNAGIQGTLNPLHKQDDREFKKVIDINIYGVFLGMKYVSRSMIESGTGGVIVNTASVAGILGPGNMAAYTASKFAVVGMTKTAAKDLSVHGIRVCAIAPGILEGKMWGTQIKGRILCRKQAQGDDSEVTEDEFKQQESLTIEGTPMKRLGKMSEVASVVTFLCSDDASYLTGITVPIDGGRCP